MNKKVIIAIVFLGIIAFILIRLNFAPKENTVVITDSSRPVQANQNIPLTLKVDSKAAFIDKKNYEEKVENNPSMNTEEYDDLEKNWEEEVKTILPSKYLAKYQAMKKKNEEEKLAAYDEFHKQLKKKFGDKFSYNISEDQSEEEKKINQRYLKELLNLIGAEDFKKYTSKKDIFNEKMRRENKEFVQIEF